MSVRDRRTFLRHVFWGATGVAGSAIGGVAGGYLIGGARQSEGIRWVPLILATEIIPGQPMHLNYRELVPDAWRTVWHSESVWLVRREQDVDVTVFAPRCTHMGCPYEWKPGDGVFKCSCHGGVFDIDGRVVAGPPPRPLDRLESRVVDGQLFVGRGASSPTSPAAS